MSSLFAVLLILSIVGLIWGLIAPHHITRITPGSRELTRKHTGFGFTALIFAFIVLVAVTAPPQKTISTTQASLTAHDQSSGDTSGPKAQAPTITTQQQTQTQPVPYTTQNQSDSSLAKGQTKVAQAGQNGTETLTYKVTYTNGKQTDKTLISTSVTTPPVSEIIDVGTYVAPGPSPTPTPTPSPAQSCYPLTNGGNCYEPGEYCRNSDHGASGLAGDGELIICADNNGWRWEPQ